MFARASKSFAPALALRSAIFAVLLTWAAMALPPMGAPRPDLRLTDAWDRTLDLKSLHGKPILILYEDKDSSLQNRSLKHELTQLGKDAKYKARMAIAPIADVQSYDYWPVRSLVKRAIRDESQSWGTPIYCDWDGTAQRALSVQRGSSQVILFDKGGRVAFAHTGPLDATQRNQLLALLRGQVEGP